MDKEENNNEMIDAGLVRMLAILSNKKWGDEDIIDDLKTLSEALAKNMVVLRYFVCFFFFFWSQSSYSLTQLF